MVMRHTLGVRCYLHRHNRQVYNPELLSAMDLMRIRIGIGNVTNPTNLPSTKGPPRLRSF